MKHIRNFNEGLNNNKLTINNLLKKGRAKHFFYHANSEEFKQTLKEIYLNSEYKNYIDILYSYYIWLTNNSNKKFITKDYLKHLEFKNYAEYPIEFICYYLSILSFDNLLKLRNDDKWWLKSLQDLINVKELTSDDLENQKIIENWILTGPMESKNNTRNAIILLSIYGKDLYDFFRKNNIK